MKNRRWRWAAALAFSAVIGPLAHVPILRSAGLQSGVIVRDTRRATEVARYVQAPSLPADLDRIFDDPVLTRALMAVRVESLSNGQLLYQRNSNKLVMPASNMKLLTMSVAAERLGWNFKYHTRLETAGNVTDGVLHGDLIVVGAGDPSIGTRDAGPSPVFIAWADALKKTGIHRIDGRLIGDGRLFDHQGLGNGWSWDYLSDGYAAPSGALSYNENVAVIRVSPGKAAGDPTRVDVLPPGRSFDIVNEITTGDAKAAAQVSLVRPLGSARVTVRGMVPAGGAAVTRTTAVQNPTLFFIDAFASALKRDGIDISGGAWDIDDVKSPPASAPRRVIDDHASAPLTTIGGYFMKISQNFYAEMLLKTVAASAGQAGTIANGRRAVRDTLAPWGVPADAFVLDDGSGLSRYDYVTADTIVAILKHMWNDEKLRGPFAALLPVAGHDGTLDTRMRNTVLDAKVEAKTGTIANVRSLSGYLETKSGERIVFSMIANNFTATTAAVDAVVEKALARIAER